MNPDDGEWIGATLKFRSDVLEEFDRLVRDGVPVTGYAEAEECEPSVFVEAVAFALA